MRIIVALPSRNEVMLDVENTTTIKQVKIEVQKHEKIFNNGILLTDDLSLEECGLTAGSKLTLAFVTQQEISLQVKSDLGYTTALVVSPLETIEKLNKKLAKQAKTFHEDQKLLHKSLELEDRKTFAEYGLQSGDTLKLRRLASKFMIQVKFEGNSHFLNVKLTDPVRKVKEQLSKIEGIRVDTQILFLNDKRLINAKTLEQSGVRGGSILELAVLQNVKFHVLVKDPSAQILCLWCEERDTVFAIKQELETLTKLPVSQQRLVFEGVNIKDDRTLEACHIYSGSTLLLSQQIQGPKPLAVQTLGGEVMNFEAEASDTVEVLKYMIHYRVLIPVPLQMLYFRGIKLEDQDTLHTYYLSKEKYIYLAEVGFRLHVESWTGEVVDVFADYFDNVATLKAKAQKIMNYQESIPMRVLYRGETLEDTHLLEEYGLREGCTVLLSLIR